MVCDRSRYRVGGTPEKPEQCHTHACVREPPSDHAIELRRTCLCQLSTESVTAASAARQTPGVATRLGILTGGGDAPGLNAVIRAAARRSFDRGYEVIGVREGWAGLVEGHFEPLGPREISGLLPRGGTIIGTSRTNPFKLEGGVERVLANFVETLDALVAIGGEDTLGVAARLYEEHDFPVVGVPKTIDNDLSATDYTFGFDTAVAVCTEAIDRLHTTAESHNRVMVVEVMGRHTGWIAVMSGIAGGADVILIPEHPISVEEACRDLQRRHERGKDFSIVVVSEGYELTYESGERRAVTQEAQLDAFGHVRLGGVGEALAREIEERTGYETRVTVLGHVQRGGTPTARDRVLATRYGLKAADLVHGGRFGRMAALDGDDIVDVSLQEATAELKTVPPEWYDVAKAFFG
jgi:phosphofructokinase-like protein